MKIKVVCIQTNSSKLPGKNIEITWTPNNTYIPSQKSTLSRLTDSVDQIFTQLSQVDFAKLLTDFDTLLKRSYCIIADRSSIATKMFFDGNYFLLTNKSMPTTQ